MSISATPCLRADLVIIPQLYGGEASFVVKDLVAQKYFRFGTVEVQVMRAFNGRRSLPDVASALAEEGLRLSLKALEGFAEKMASLGFLERTTAERSTLQLERLRAERRSGQRSAWFRGELLRMRWSFGDPDTMLAKTLPYVRWMFTRSFVIASVAIFALYLLLLALRWSEFSRALVNTYSFHSMTVTNVVALWVTGALVILIHELGHAYACKYFGGEVRELGFMMLYFQPAFYCNVSDAWSFPQRSARLWVTAAGGWIQLVVASLAAFVWWAAAPGTLVASVALAAMLVGGVSTLFTNANPLLPLDGYFALTDWLEIPNLRLRALAHFQWWLRARVLRLDLPQPSVSARERRVFLLYGSLAFVYAVGMFTLIGTLALGWAGRAFGVMGVITVLVLLQALLRKRVANFVREAANAFRARRGAPGRLRRRLLIGVGALALVLALVPWSLTTGGEFVVHPVSSRTVTALDSGVVAQSYVRAGTHVEAGAPLVRIVNRSLEHELLIASGVVDSLAAAELAARASGRSGDASRLGAERAAALATLSSLDRHLGALTLRATSAGMIATARPEDLVGRRVSAGDSLLSVVAIDSVELRISLAGAGATHVRSGQPVHLFSFAGAESPWTSRVDDVSTSGFTQQSGGPVIEARVRRAANGMWLPGTIGEASIELRRSNVLGALAWKARQLLRVDLLL